MSFFHEIAAKNPKIGKIFFKSVTSGVEIDFPAFITAFNDNITIGFGGETAFGRNDPVKHYQSTSRQMQVSFDIVGIDEQHSLENFQKYSQLVQMCYPVYSSPIGTSNMARTIKAPPLWRVKYANYISSPTGQGLLGCINGVSFSPKFDSGHFVTTNDKLVPIVYSLNFNFQPLHESPLGFSETGQFLSREFPYNFANKVKAGPVPAGEG